MSLRRAASLSIARAMKVNVPTRILTRLDRPAAASAEAYESYALGRYLLERASRAELERARIELERAIELESSFAPAHAALAHLHLNLGSSGRSAWETHGELARISARRALELDNGIAEAEAVLAEVAFQLDWDWKGAAAAFQRAVSLSTSYEFARQRYAHFLAARGQVEQGLEELRAAQAVDPVLRQYRSRARSDAAVRGAFLRGRNDRDGRPRSRAQCPESARAAGPHFLRHWPVRPGQPPSFCRSRILRLEAPTSTRKWRVRTPEPAESRKRRRSWTASSSAPNPRKFHPSSSRWCTQGSGQVDEAFAYLERAVALKSRRILWLKVDPRWDPLRADPRFDALLGRLGL